MAPRDTNSRGERAQVTDIVMKIRRAELTKCRQARQVRPITADGPDETRGAPGESPCAVIQVQGCHAPRARTVLASRVGGRRGACARGIVEGVFELDQAQLAHGVRADALEKSLETLQCHCIVHRPESRRANPRGGGAREALRDVVSRETSLLGAIRRTTTYAALANFTLSSS